MVQGSAGFIPGALRGARADVAYLGIGQLGLMPPSYLEQYWRETARTVGAGHVVLIHWDDFFRPLDQPLRALPYAGDDLDVTLGILTHLAHQEEPAEGPVRLAPEIGLRLLVEEDHPPPGLRCPSPG